MKFDGPVTLLQVNSMQISENAKLLTTVPVTAVSPTTLQFIFTAVLLFDESYYTNRVVLLYDPAI